MTFLDPDEMAAAERERGRLEANAEAASLLAALRRASVEDRHAAGADEQPDDDEDHAERDGAADEVDDPGDDQEQGDEAQKRDHGASRTRVG